MPGADRYDAIVVGGGHNGLVAATVLRRAGCSVLVLERASQVGGAAISAEVFPGARVSRFAYLVSLFPRWLARELGLTVELRRREVSWYAPGVGLGGGSDPILVGVGERVLPTLTEPLYSRDAFRELIGEPWEALFERPLSELLEATIADDVLRGVALTDATIGTFAPADDPDLRQNRCFLYHIAGGSWDVPVGGMGAISAGLERGARGAGVEIRTHAEVTGIEPDGIVTCADGRSSTGHHVLAGIAPAVLTRLMGEPDGDVAPEGSQLKINMLLRRLPRLRDVAVSSEQAFTGTFHVNEGYEQLQRAYEQAAAGQIPSLPPCELYCHSLTDPSILSDELRAAGAHTLTLFGLHMPARVFRADPAGAKRAAVAATLKSVNSALAEPLEDCLALDADGEPCLEAHSPVDIEAELAMPGGNIFHRDLSWPFAESDEEVGRWGVETAHPNVWLCGAGARRGGCVSGIPGYNAAQAVLEALRG
ncbi:MAG TPA: NAD(P)/FAD-dependent oxidoreductase [Solirubrobacteraceae bacterium]